MLLDRRAHARVLDHQPHEARGPPPLRLRDEVVELLPRELSATGSRDPLDPPAGGHHRCERVEAGPGEDTVQVRELHAVTEVRLVGSVSIDDFLVGEARERRWDVDPVHLAHELCEQRLHQREDVLLVHERHLQVELGELEPAVGPRRLVTEAPDDLVVAVLAGDHEQLLQLLRRLRQRVERPREQASRDQEVAGALRRAAPEHRRLDIDEATLVEVFTDRADHPVPEREHLRHLRSPQVQVPELQSQVLVRLGAVLDGERRRVGLRQQLQCARGDLDVARLQRGIHHAFRTEPDDTGHTHDVFGAERLRGRVGFRGLARVEHQLHGSLAVAEIDERHAAVVATMRDPTAERDVGPRVARTELSARMRTHGRSHVHACLRPRLAHLSPPIRRACSATRRRPPSGPTSARRRPAV